MHTNRYKADMITRQASVARKGGVKRAYLSVASMRVTPLSQLHGQLWCCSLTGQSKQPLVMHLVATVVSCDHKNAYKIGCRNAGCKEIAAKLNSLTDKHGERLHF